MPVTLLVAFVWFDNNLMMHSWGVKIYMTVVDFVTAYPFCLCMRTLGTLRCTAT